LIKFRIFEEEKNILSALILSIALNSPETKLIHKFTAQVSNYHLGSSNLGRLGPDLIPVFFLADIGKEAHDFVALVQQPSENAAGVKTAYE
jgi:hypothetical protein